MVNYIKTTNGYFYKICKNGKKRISEDEYNKQRKLKKMTGGILLGYVKNIEQSNSRNLMENVFLTGNDNISSRIFTIEKVKESFMSILEQIKNIKNNNSSMNNSRKSLAYVGEIDYFQHRPLIWGESFIWIHLNHLSGKVRYYVKIMKNNNYDYGNHVMVALYTLCKQNCNLIIKALLQLGIDLKCNIHRILEIKSKCEEDITNIKKDIERLKQELDIKTKELTETNKELGIPCKDFNWTFSIELPQEQNN